MFQVLNPKGLVDISIGQKDVDDLELKNLYRSFEIIYFLQPISYAYESIERNVTEFETFVLRISDPSNGLFRGILNHMEVISSLAEAQQRLTNLLSSANAFLNLVESKLKSNYGNNSQQLVLWNDFRRSLHKEHISYRFMYELRNYALHCGLPVSSLKVDMNELASDIPKKNVKINLSKMKILNSNYDWKSVKKDIDGLEESANLTELALEYGNIIKHLYLYLLKIFAQELSASKNCIDAFYEKHNIPGECTAQIALGWKDGDDLSNINCETMPINELKWILRDTK